MKKLVIALLVLCLIAAAVIGTVSVKNSTAFSSASEPTAAAAADGTDSPADFVVTGGEYTSPEAVTAAPLQAEVTPSSEPTPAPERLDYDALFALHEKDELVLKVGDREERWGDFFYVLFSQCSQIENYFDSMAAYYGMLFSWKDPVEEDSDETFAETAVETAETLTAQLAALEQFADENGITLGEEELARVEEQKNQDRIEALGEDGTEEEFREVREQVYLSDEMYDRIVRQNILYQTCFNRLYGEKAEKLSDEKALKYLEDNGYLSAAHILLQNTDPETGEKLDEEALAAKRAELEALIEELRAIEDEEERAKAFLEKISELSEDPGSAYYPEGYTFTEGTMVPEFENAAKELEDFAVSDIVETTYGYHVLLRMPLKADAIVEYNSSTGDARTARMLAANALYGEQLQAVADSLELTWLPGYEAPNLLDFLHSAE